MRALLLRSFNGPDALSQAEIPEPRETDLVIIDVHTSGISYADALALRGKYQLRLSPPFVPGMEIAGYVRTAPADSGFHKGDRVASFVRWGAWAEVVATQPCYTFRIPAELAFEEAVALTLNYRTSYFALVWRGGLQESETVVAPHDKLT